MELYVDNPSDDLAYPAATELRERCSEADGGPPSELESEPERKPLAPEEKAAPG